MIFFGENMQNSMNSPCFWPKITHPAQVISFNGGGRSERPELVRLKMAMLFFPVYLNSKIYALHKFR
jgi:hypothetical protein